MIFDACKGVKVVITSATETMKLNMFKTIGTKRRNKGKKHYLFRRCFVILARVFVEYVEGDACR